MKTIIHNIKCYIRKIKEHTHTAVQKFKVWKVFNALMFTKAVYLFDHKYSTYCEIYYNSLK